MPPSKGRKGNSIKTRIETLVVLTHAFVHLFVEKAIPLKQGLKLMNGALVGFTPFGVEKAIPLKQGLKPSTTCRFHPWLLVEKAIPLKQGLKLC